VPADAKAAEKAQLLTRWRLTIDAVERAEPGHAGCAELRAIGEANANRLGALRELGREASVMAAMLPAPIRAELETALAAAGIDVTGEHAAEAADVAAIRARGHIRTEAEYRRVQAYANRIGVDPRAQAEFLTLGQLLDEFMSRGAA
jgi:hypothetical protein